MSQMEASDEAGERKGEVRGLICGFCLEWVEVYGFEDGEVCEVVFPFSFGK